MSLAAKIRNPWDERLARAIDLERSYPFAADVLDFYRQVAAFQQSLYAGLQDFPYAIPACSSRLPEELDLSILLPHMASFLQIVERHAPEPLAEAANKFEERGADSWRELLNSYWLGEDAPENPARDWFLARAFLQPLAEYLAFNSSFEKGSNYTSAVCPFCRRKPVLGTLRPEGDGARRSLVCSFCATEWNFRRIVCPNCTETNMEKLPIYTAEDFAHVRVEACDSCRCFIKTVDLSRNGHANPIVDELATIPLTLWALEKGYTKLEVNLLGM